MTHNETLTPMKYKVTIEYSQETTMEVCALNELQAEYLALADVRREIPCSATVIGVSVKLDKNPS